jgi:hypothetical protein
MSLQTWNNKKIIVENTARYMVGQDFDIVEEARGKKIADPLRAKLMGMEDIRALKGTMTPRYFATKVIRFLQKNYPELDISNLSDDDIQKAINVVAQVSKPLSQKPDVKITTRERGAAEGGLQRGDTGFETLKLNLGDNAVLKSEGEVGKNDLYTVVKDGLKYRVTLNKFKGQKLNLDDISQDDVVSVVVVKPSEMETVDKFAGEVELGQREKLVADYPEGEEETMDMDDVIDAVKKMSFYKNKLTADRYGRKHGISQERDLEDYELEDRRMRMQFPVDPDEEIGPEDAECAYSDEEDFDGDGKIESPGEEYKGARDRAIKNAMEKERKRAVADHYEGGEDFDNREKSNIKFSVGSVGGQHGQIMHIDKTFDSLEDACNHAGVDVQDCISGEWDDMGDGTKEYGVDEDTVIIMHVAKAEDERARGEAIAKAMKKEQERAGQSHARAVADHYKDKDEEDEQVAISPQQINQQMINQYRQNLQRQYGHERLNRHGY